MNIKVLKCHGSANDFVLIDEFNSNHSFTEEERVILSKVLCDRKGVIGADGILFFLKSSKADARMRIFNADGSEPEMCGNGLRCLGRYACETLNKDTVLIETMKGNLEVVKEKNIFDNVKTFKVQIGPVSLNVKDLPLNYDNSKLIDNYIEGFSSKHKFTAVSIPNPHIISLVDDINIDELTSLAAKANEDKSIFPCGVNVSFVKVLGECSIFVQTFERGVGLTNACGTGMCASTLTTCLLGVNSTGSIINVFNRGGMVRCIVNEDNSKKYSAFLIGNATYVFKGEVDLDFKKHTALETNERIYFHDENNYYNELVKYTQNIVSNIK